ncbi:hypothetical protein I3760_16G055700 [Carya illinoinensis]|nr:hypothetical protein I3760_16G055700 [Carya illinoinensis]
MEGSCKTTLSNGESANHSLQIIRYQPCINLSSPWFDLRVFYVRISHFHVDDSTPEFLSLNHIPLSPDTVLEVNGARSSSYSDGVCSVLRRDRVDKKSEDATFVGTDSIRLTGSVKFEVFDKEDLILSGVLEMSNSNGFMGELINSTKRWNMNCEPVITAGAGFLKGKQLGGPEFSTPTMEVYVAGCFSGTPIILTKTLQLSFRKKHNRNGMLDVIPEHETTESHKNMSPEDLQSCLHLSVWSLMHSELLELLILELDLPYSILARNQDGNTRGLSNVLWLNTEATDQKMKMTTITCLGGRNT